MIKGEVMSKLSNELASFLNKTNEDQNVDEGFGYDPDDVKNAILMIARNDAKFYRTKDAKGAVKYAIKEYVKAKVEELKDEIDDVKGEMIKELGRYWKGN